MYFVQFVVIGLVYACAQAPVCILHQMYLWYSLNDNDNDNDKEQQ